MHDDNHEMYKRAPVALVAAQIIFPGDITAPVSPAITRAVAELLGDEWVHEPLPRITVNLLGPAPMIAEPPTVEGSPILRFADRERGSAVALTSGSVSVETVRYHNWPHFRATVETVLEATDKLLRPTGVLRAGIRYIDEIRVDSDQPRWSEWLSPMVVAPAVEAMASSGWDAANWNGAVQYRTADERQLILRYGPQPALPGFIVNPDGPLRRPAPRPQGPFFMLDFDASWQPTAVPRWTTESVLATLDGLRQSVRSLFDSVISDRLENEVFHAEEVREK